MKPRSTLTSSPLLNLLTASLAAFAAACGDDALTAADPFADPGPDRIHDLPGDPPTTEIPLERDQAGGLPAAVRVAGGRAYLGVGPRLAVWDVTGATPTLLGETAPLDGLVSAVALAGDHALVATWTTDDGRIEVVDVSDPTHPRATSAIHLGDGAASRPVALALDGTRLYVADARLGLFDVDVADLGAPLVIAHLDDLFPVGVQRVGDRLYAHGTNLTGTWVQVLDPAHGLNRLGGTSMSSTTTAAVTPAHLAVGVGPGGIRVHDLSDPSAPELRYSATNPATRVVTGAGRYVYVTTDDGVHVLDVPTTGPVEHTGPLPMATAGASAAAVADGRLVVASDRGRLVVAELVDPRAPAPGAFVPLGGAAVSMAVASDGTDLVVAEAGAGGHGALAALRLADLSARSRVPLSGRATLVGVVVADGVAYVADRIAGLHVVDVAAAELVDTLVSGGPAAALAVDGARLYTGSAVAGSLTVYDRERAREPVELAQIGIRAPRGMAARDGLVIVADEGPAAAGGLRIFDAADPDAIELLGELDDCTGASDVALVGTTALVPCGFDGFALIDVTDPWAPVRVATVAVTGGGYAWSVAGRGDLAYLGHTRGVTVIDLSDPADPIAIAELPTAALVRDLAVAVDGRVVAAAGPAGVYQWDVAAARK